MAWREVDVLAVRDGSIKFDFVAVLYLGISGMTGHEKKLGPIPGKQWYDRT